MINRMNRFFLLLCLFATSNFAMSLFVATDNPQSALEDNLKNKKFEAAYKLLQKKPLEIFVPIVLKYTNALNDYYWGTMFLELVLEKLPSSRIVLAQKAANEIKTFPYNLISVIASYKESAAIIDKAIISLVETGDIKNIFNGIALNESLYKNLPLSLTPTTLHFSKAIRNTHNYLVSQYLNDEKLSNLLSDIVEKEKELAAKNFYTFIHAQRRGYYCAERMYTFLWNLKHNTFYDNFLFAHVKPTLSGAELKEENELRDYLLKHGRKPKDPVTRQKLLFLNYAFFAQMYDMGSNSADFVMHNHNYGSAPISITTKDAFEYLGYGNIYKKYQKELEELDAAYTKGTYGNVLLIAVPKEKIKDLVFLCQAGKGGSGMGGVKRSVWIKGIGETKDIGVIMDHLLNKPNHFYDIDNLEFCLVMTQENGGLDPKTGIQVHPILSGDKIKLAELAQKETDLCKRIKQDINEMVIK